MGLLSICVSSVAKLRCWTRYFLKFFPAVISWILRHLLFICSQTSPNHPICTSCDCTSPVASPPWRMRHPVERTLSLNLGVSAPRRATCSKLTPPITFKPFEVKCLCQVCMCVYVCVCVCVCMCVCVYIYPYVYVYIYVYMYVYFIYIHTHTHNYIKPPSRSTNILSYI